MKKPNVLAIIPARGGSKGLQRKNIIPLCGKPLIAYTIEAALGSKLVDKTVVSTEDKEITKVSKQYGAEVIKRPEKLARDESPTSEAVLHVIDWFEAKGQFFNIIVLLEPTSPLRNKDDIDNAVGLFIENMDNADSLVSVGEVHMENPYIVKKIEKGLVRPLIEINKTFYQRAQLPKVYFPYGVIYLSKVETYRTQKTFYQKRTIPYLIQRWQNYEIDDIWDLICIEAIMKKMQEGSPEEVK